MEALEDDDVALDREEGRERQEGDAEEHVLDHVVDRAEIAGQCLPAPARRESTDSERPIHLLLEFVRGVNPVSDGSGSCHFLASDPVAAFVKCLTLAARRPPAGPHEHVAREFLLAERAESYVRSFVCAVEKAAHLRFFDVRV